MSSAGKKAEKSLATRGALVAAARALFTERGYAATGTEAIVERAGVTRGAMYHHFRDKEDLFLAVYHDVETEVTQKVVEALSGMDAPMERIRAGVAAFLDACLTPDVRRIALQEGPSILGWERKREIDGAYGFGLVHTALQNLMEAGVIARRPLEPLTHLLLGALNEGAMYLAHTTDPRKARDEIGEAVAALFDGLRQPLA